MILAKQHNLVLFRELCDASVALPQELFTYDSSIATSPEIQAVKAVFLWTDTTPTYNLSGKIQKVYPGLDWIVPYFVFSTFPTIFGHFISDEYVHAGLRFIEAHVLDPLAPHLVGIFLLHCFLFRDRLMQIFYEQLCMKPADTQFTGSLLLDAFKQSFVFCVPYF
jgi:hypothetical protein